MSDSTTCDACRDTVREPLARTVRLSVDRSQIDVQQLCPDCFAEWIDRYDREMTTDSPSAVDDDSDIIVD